MAESYGNILSLPNDQFMSMLPELQAQGVDTDELRRSYRRANSIFSPLYDWMGGSEANVAEQGRSPVGFGLLSKPEGTTGMDAVRGLQLEPQQFMSGLLGAVAQGADAPYAAVQGQMPTQDMMGEAMNMAGLAMGSGGVVADIPAGAVGANMLRGGKMSDISERGNNILNLLKSGRASEVTDSMLDMGDPLKTSQLNEYLYKNYDLPMDHASRMQRASDMGYDMTPMYRGAPNDEIAFNPEKYKPTRPYIYSSDNPYIASSYAKNANRAALDNSEMTNSPVVAPLLTKRRGILDVDAGGTQYGQIPFDEPITPNGQTLRQVLGDDAHGFNINGVATTDTDLVPYWAIGDNNFNSVEFKNIQDRGNETYYNYNTKDIPLKSGEVYKSVSGTPDTEFMANMKAPSTVRVNRPEDVRSQFARFDPRLDSSRNLLAANASKTGGAFASLFNQEAQAFNKAALDPAGLSGVKMPDFVQNIDYKATPTGLLAPQVNIDIADMKGKTLIPAYGDRTYGGANLTEIGGVKLDQPVQMQGGHDFMRDQETGLWASEKSPMNTKARFIDDLIAEGEDPALVYTAMGGQSGDFSHHMGDTVMGMVEQSKITKAAAKGYDKTIRDTVDPKWVGILSPKAREYLDTKMTGSDRRLLWQEMDKTKWSDQGFPHVGVARTAITDPELLTVAPFSSGLSIGQPSGGGLLSLGNNRPHKSYSSQIGGDYMGKLENQVSGDVMWRDFFGDRRAAGVKPSGDQRSFMMSPYIKQKVDDQMIDEVSTIMERLRKVGK